MDRWLARLVAIAALVIIGLLALALLGGRADGAGGRGPGDPTSAGGAAASATGASAHRTGTAGGGPFVALSSRTSEV